MAERRRGLKAILLIFLLGTVGLAVAQRAGGGYLKSFEIFIAFLFVLLIPRLRFLNYRMIGGQLRIYELTFFSIYFFGGIVGYIYPYLHTDFSSYIFSFLVDISAIFLSLSLGYSFYRLYHMGASKKRKFLLAFIVAVFFLSLFYSSLFSLLVLLILIHGAKITGLSSSHHSTRIKLFLLLVIFWLVFFFAPRGIFLAPKPLAGGLYFGSGLYSLFIKSFIPYIILFTLRMAVSLVETSRRLSTKSAISYIFQALIPISVLTAVIAGNIIFLSVSLKLFFLHRDYIIHFDEYTKRLFSDSSFIKKAGSTPPDELAEELVAPLVRSFPGIFALVRVESNENTLSGASSLTPAGFSAAASSPEWIIDEHFADLIERGDSYFIAAYREVKRDGEGLALNVFIPVSGELIRMVENEYQVRFGFVSGGEKVFPSTETAVIDISDKKTDVDVKEGRLSSLSSFILSYPLTAVNWETGDKERFADLRLYETYGALFSLRSSKTPSTFSYYLILVRVINMVVLIIAFVIIITSTYIGGRISRGMKVSLVKLVEGVRRIGCGELDCRIRLPSRDEYYQLARSINLMTDDLKRYLEELVENERIKQELITASAIQMSMLPLADPKIEGYEIVSYFRPAKEVGGDYYDYLPLKKDKLALVIGDVSGEGISAGLLMAMAKSCLLNQIRVSDKVPDVMFAMNNMVHEALRKRLLMTLCYSVLDISSRVLRFTSAGHHFPYLYSRKTRELSALESVAYPLGVRKNMVYKEKKVKLRRGDRLILYTDGIIEARNPEGEEFGFDRFEEVILSYAEVSAREIREGILNKLTDFTRGEPQLDDITLVVIRIEED
jgi:serine phosphatase RsbU (regulator of sigma subunit)